MRRKNTKGSSKSSQEPKPVRRSTRNSRRKKSPSDTSDSDNEPLDTLLQLKRNDHKELSTSSHTDSEIEKGVVEEKQESTVISSTNITIESNTPPQEKPVNIDAIVTDEVKGKSKDISKSQVEENTEIEINSIAADDSKEESTSKDNDVSTDITNENQERDEKEPTQIVEEEIIPPEIAEEKHYHIESEEQETTESTNVTAESEKQEGNKELNVEKVNGEELGNDKKIKEKDEEQTEEGEIRSKSDEDETKINETPDNEPVKKPPPVKVKLRRNSLFEALEQSIDSVVPPPKRMRWDPDEHGCLKLDFTDFFKLDVDDFKALSADLKLADESDVKLEEVYEPKRADAGVVRERADSTKEIAPGADEQEENTNIIALNRKISIVDDEAAASVDGRAAPPSPAKQPPSPLLFISNLVRPFTVKQLRELLERTGSIVENGFWTDRIKSKCYVEFASTEEAETTRNALHGVNWPVGNGKKLIIEYATKEEMEKAMNPPVAPPAPVPEVPPVVCPVKEVEKTDTEEKLKERKRKDSERRKEREHAEQQPTRDWNNSKETKRERSRSRDRRRRHSGRRSATPIEDYVAAKKQKKFDDTVSQKLMDDLFLKTKTMPCIYWQPLSPEEISVKQQQRLTRMEEHKRRLEEKSRPKGGREPPRGASYRRRYD